MFRHYAVRWFTVLTLLAAVACESPTGPQETIPVTRVLQGFFSNAPAPQRLVIRSAREFEDTLASMFISVTMPPMNLDVDFSREMVIIVMAGAKPSGGYCIAVESATADRRTMEVAVRSGGPTPTMAILPVITHPFDVVRVPRRDEVRFSETSFVGNCGPLT